MRGRGTRKGGVRRFTNIEELKRQNLSTGEDEDEETSSGEDEEEDEENEVKNNEDYKPKGVSHLIATANPNHVPGKQVNRDDAPLSRRERESIQLSTMDPLKLKSEQELAQDMARLQLVRKEREEAAKKRDDERKAREAAKEIAQARANERIEALKNKGGKKGGKKGTKPKPTPHSDTAASSTTGDDDAVTRPTAEA